MKKVQSLIVAGIIIYFLITIFAAIALYKPDLVRNKYLAISEQFPQNITAIFAGLAGVATLVLAYIAYISITENRRIRDEDIDREHKRKALIEIGDWAMEGYDLFYGYRGSSYTHSEEWEKRLTRLWAKKEAIVVASEEFHTDFSQSVKDARDELNNYWNNHAQWDLETAEGVALSLEGRFAVLYRLVAETRAKLKL
ncbi:MAG TPA: hypothetical protein G4O01_07135 [Dehalococcoidia bacterium]|jgi:uncharacterized integral membrane protein|nr:hypothetical protein [Dehalococcoidia bacterium]